MGVTDKHSLLTEFHSESEFYLKCLYWFKVTMSGMQLRLQRELFAPNNEQLLSLVHCISDKDKNKTKDIYLCLINETDYTHGGGLTHNLIEVKIHIFKISFLTKFTISRYHFSQNSQFQNHIFHKIYIFKVSFFTKFTFFKHQFLGNFWTK